MKRIVIIAPDGAERVLDGMPSMAAMQVIVGGPTERVRVLERVKPSGEGVYTWMIVNEEGLLRLLPRNDKATIAYQRNVRTAFAGAANPFRACDEAFARRAESLGPIIDMTPQSAIAAGYKDDPWIAGTVILFEGWTCAEVDAQWR